MRLPLLTALLILAAMSQTACSLDEGEDTATEEAVDALRSLTAQEIVGSIAYGETKSVAYTDTPLYRALSFTAEAGDEVAATVAGVAGADARAWLVRSTFGTIASNDDATPNTLDASLTATINKSGTYYIVFREKKHADTTFEVTLQKTNGQADAGATSPPGPDDHPALPPGPVAITLDGYGRGQTDGRGVPIHMKCALSGVNPGPVDVSCVVTAPYEGLGFSASGKMVGDGANLRYSYSSTSTSGTRYDRRGHVSFAFIARGDTIWARMGASYESTAGFERKSFSTLYPALVRIQGQAEPTEITSTEEISCDSVCQNAGLVCLDASAATAKWVAFEGCETLGSVPSTMASCQTIFRPRAGFSGEVCAFRLHCGCI